MKFVEFATILDVGGAPPRMMFLADEPGSRRMFVSGMQGPLFSLSYDGKTVATYLDLNAPSWTCRSKAVSRTVP